MASRRRIKSMKALASRLARIGSAGLPGWRPRDSPKRLVGDNRCYGSMPQSVGLLHSKPFFLCIVCQPTLSHLIFHYSSSFFCFGR